MPNKITFVAWNITKRSKVLAEHLNAETITYRIPANRIFKLFNYPFLILLTFSELLHQKPDIIFVQLPPIQVSIPTYLYSKLFRKKLIFDTHSGIFFTQGLHQRLYLRLYCKMIKHINLNIVHNESIISRDCLRNTPSIVLECKIPFRPSEHKKNTPLKLTVVCGYGKDEPIQEILQAAQLTPDIKFYLTGNSTKLKNKRRPENVELTEYLSDIEYENFLQTTDIIIVLTTRPDTVLSGAYEAVGLEKPLITSNTKTLTQYFYKGTIFTANDAKSIAEAVNQARKNLDKLHIEMKMLRKEKEIIWQKQFEPVEKILI